MTFDLHVGEYKSSQEWFITRETQDIRVVGLAAVGDVMISSNVDV